MKDNEDGLEKHEWDESQVESASTPNYSKEKVAKPVLEKILPNVKGKKILEIGCGEGYWLRFLEDGASECVGVDIEEEQIRKAREKENSDIEYYVMDARNLEQLYDEEFDIVLIMNVFLEIESIEIIREILEEVYKVLGEGGVLIVQDLHPASAHMDLPNFKPAENYSYFNEGSKIKVTSKRVDDEETKYVDFHWTLSTLLNSIIEAGFDIERVREPHPDEKTVKEFPYLEYRKDEPVDIMIKSRKSN